MVWAIDLDDGSLIEALGANIKRKKTENRNVTKPYQQILFRPGYAKLEL